jgi:hypothetical protein
VVTVNEQVAESNGRSASAAELTRLRAENARLLRLLNLTRQEADPPEPCLGLSADEMIENLLNQDQEPLV